MLDGLVLLQALIEQCVGFSPADRQPTVLGVKIAAASHIETAVVWITKTYDGLAEAVLLGAKVLISDVGPLRTGSP